MERIELRSALAWRRDCWALIHRHWAVAYHDVHRAESERLLAALDAVTAENGRAPVPMTRASVACLEAAVHDCAASGEVIILEIGESVQLIVRAVRAALERSARVG